MTGEPPFIGGYPSANNLAPDDLLIGTRAADGATVNFSGNLLSTAIRQATIEWQVSSAPAFGIPLSGRIFGATSLGFGTWTLAQLASYFSSQNNPYVESLSVTVGPSGDFETWDDFYTDISTKRIGQLSVEVSGDMTPSLVVYNFGNCGFTNFQFNGNNFTGTLAIQSGSILNGAHSISGTISATNDIAITGFQLSDGLSLESTAGRVILVNNRQDGASTITLASYGQVEISGFISGNHKNGAIVCTNSSVIIENTDIDSVTARSILIKGNSSIESSVNNSSAPIQNFIEVGSAATAYIGDVDCGANGVAYAMAVSGGELNRTSGTTTGTFTNEFNQPVGVPTDNGCIYAAGAEKSMLSTVAGQGLSSTQKLNAQSNLGVEGNDRYMGDYDASSNLFPSTGGSGVSGAIRKGDWFKISVAGIGFAVGDTVSALTNVPGQTASNWLYEKSYLNMANSSLLRKVPTGLPSLPIALLSAQGVGDVSIFPNDAITACRIYNASITNSGIYYVKPSTGSDSNAGTFAAPFATLTKAFRTATGSASRVVILEDAVFPPFDLRQTDASQTVQQLKWLDANGYNVIIRDDGPVLASQTWVVDGTNTNCYKSTLATSGSQAVTRVLRTDRLDEFGHPVPFRKYTSAALLNAGVGDGWYWDSVGKVLWLKIGAGTNVESQKSILRGIYTGSSGSSRILAYGAAIGFRGVRFEGVILENQELGSRRPQIWLHDCEQLWAYDKGFNATHGGVYVATDTDVYSSLADGANGFAKGPVHGKGFIQTAHCRYIYTGDIRVFASNLTLQGISAHGGCDHASFGTSFHYCNGPGVQDTCSNGETDATWLVGCSTMGDSDVGNCNNYAFGSVATTASRKVYMDLCASEAPAGTGMDLQIDVNATVYTSSTPLIVVTGGSVTNYSPVSPP